MSSYANKGKALETLIEYANKQYNSKGLAQIQKISTPWNVVRRGKKIVSAYPEDKSTLDFRGTVKGGASVSFDCKETNNKKGLPLQNIADHQIKFMRRENELGGICFLVVHMKDKDKYYRIMSSEVVMLWDKWKSNKGKRGYNTILEKDMEVIKQGRSVVLDYLEGIV